MPTYTVPIMLKIYKAGKQNDTRYKNQEVPFYPCLLRISGRLIFIK